MYNGVRVLVLLCKKEADLSAEGSRNISLFVSMMRMFAEEGKGPPMNMDEHSEYNVMHNNPNTAIVSLHRLHRHRHYIYDPLLCYSAYWAY
jgi:hypothetical protein